MNSRQSDVGSGLLGVFEVVRGGFDQSVADFGYLGRCRIRQLMGLDGGGGFGVSDEFGGEALGGVGLL